MTDVIKPSCDRKTRNWKGQRNTFGLLPVVTCPGATHGEGGCCWIKKGCKNMVCYVDGLMKAYVGVKNVLKHNTDIMMNAPQDEMQDMMETEFARFRSAEFRRASRLKDYEPFLNYRIHWSGDFFSNEYARAAVNAMWSFPDIKFWAYTRTFNVLPILSVVDNLSMYVSLDACNMCDGMTAYYKYHDMFYKDNLRVCYLSPTKSNDFMERWTAARKHATKLDIDWPVKPPKLQTCPCDAGTMNMEGVCTKCQRCLWKKTQNSPNIWFCP